MFTYFQKKNHVKKFIKFVQNFYFYIFLNLFHVYVDPRLWTEEHVALWLDWAKNEFSIDPKDSFSKMRGRDMVVLGREQFLAIAPPYTGDILWEHLEILQKGKL